MASKADLTELAFFARVALAEASCTAHAGEQSAAERLWKRGLVSKNDFGIRRNPDTLYAVGDFAGDVIDRLLDVMKRQESGAR